MDNGQRERSGIGGRRPHCWALRIHVRRCGLRKNKKHRQRVLMADCKRRVSATATTWQHCRTAFAAPPPTLPPPCNSFFVSPVGLSGAGRRRLRNRKLLYDDNANTVTYAYTKTRPNTHTTHAHFVVLRYFYTQIIITIISSYIMTTITV